MAHLASEQFIDATLHPLFDQTLVVFNAFSDYYFPEKPNSKTVKLTKDEESLITGLGQELNSIYRSIHLNTETPPQDESRETTFYRRLSEIDAVLVCCRTLEVTGEIKKGQTKKLRDHANDLIKSLMDNYPDKIVLIKSIYSKRMTVTAKADTSVMPPNHPHEYADMSELLEKSERN